MGYCAGDVIARIEPSFHTIRKEYFSRTCSWCLKITTFDKLKRCSRCMKLCYCNRKCQKAHWEQHQHECTWLKTYESKNGDIFGKREHFDRCNRFFNSTDKEEFTLMTNKIPFEIYHKGRIDDLFGHGVYKAMHEYENSCVPNAYHVFEGKTLVLRAARNISKNENIKISRADFTKKPSIREEELSLRWSLECKCDVCAQKNIVNKCLLEFIGLLWSVIRKESVTLDGLFGTFEPLMNGFRRPVQPIEGFCEICINFMDSFTALGIKYHPVLAQAFIALILHVDYNQGKLTNEKIPYETIKNILIGTYGGEHEIIQKPLKILQLIYEN